MATCRERDRPAKHSLACTNIHAVLGNEIAILTIDADFLSVLTKAGGR